MVSAVYITAALLGVPMYVAETPERGNRTESEESFLALSTPSLSNTAMVSS